MLELLYSHIEGTMVSVVLWNQRLVRSRCEALQIHFLVSKSCRKTLSGLRKQQGPCARATGQ